MKEKIDHTFIARIAEVEAIPLNAVEAFVRAQLEAPELGEEGLRVDVDIATGRRFGARLGDQVRITIGEVDVDPADEGKHAMQPVVWDGKGVMRFQANPIVRYLLDHGGIKLNALFEMSDERGWTDADHAHFAQLTGYSVSAWASLPFVSAAEVLKADARTRELLARHPEDPAKALDAQRGAIE